METIGDRIKKVRKALRLTQVAFAKRIGTVQNTLTGYERGRFSPSSPVITLICREFHVNEEWLRTGAGEMNTLSTRTDEIAAAVHKMFPDESEDFRRQFAKILSSLKEEMWQVLLKKMMEMQELYAKKDSPKEKAAPEISEADMEAYDRVNAYFDEHPDERIKKERERLSACSKDADAG